MNAFMRLGDPSGFAPFSIPISTILLITLLARELAEIPLLFDASQIKSRVGMLGKGGLALSIVFLML
jgi:hypothetical protein